jgi:hypothetical protein
MFGRNQFGQTSNFITINAHSRCRKVKLGLSWTDDFIMISNLENFHTCCLLMVELAADWAVSDKNELVGQGSRQQQQHNLLTTRKSSHCF